MARRVFFSFHYEQDIWRVSQIRNSGIVLAPGDTTAGFIDNAEWESIERQGDAGIQRWIDAQLNGTSVTVVLIGSETAQRRWVNYEIIASIKRGNGLLGVYINEVKNQWQQPSPRGPNPFDYIGWNNGQGEPISRTYPTYDWLAGNGRANLSTWVEAAAKKAGR
jgi:hypothetical protein